MDRDNMMTIKRLEVTQQSHKTLGVRLKPLGLFNDKFDFLLSKAKWYTTRLASLSLGSYDSLLFYKSSFMSGGVGYSFPVVPLSFDSAKKPANPHAKRTSQQALLQLKLTNHIWWSGNTVHLRGTRHLQDRATSAASEFRKRATTWQIVDHCNLRIAT
jgi:hypothetical protein